MATQLQIRRGTTAQMNAFTGAEGELAVNTTTDTLHVHDGATAGGKALARADGSNIATYAGSFSTLAASGAATLNTLASSGATLTGGTINGVTVGATIPSTGAFTTIAASGAITGNVTGNLTGSVLTAAQTNITSVGTLSTLAVTGTADVTLDLNVGGAVKGNAGTRVVSVGTAGSVIGGLQLWSTTAGASYVQFGDEAGTSANHYRGYMSYSHANDSMALGTSGSTKVTIGSSGSVGIGGSPSAPLHVKSSTGNAIFLLEHASPTVGTGQVSRFVSSTSNVTDVIDSNGYYRIGSSTAPNTGAGFTERIRLNSAGSLLINSSVTADAGGNKLFINSGVNALPATSGTTQTGGALRLRGANNAVLDMGLNSVYTWIQATDKANLANGYSLSLNPNGGNVGIGLASPSYLIHADAATATDPSYFVASSGSNFVVAMGSQNSPGVAQEAFVGTLSNHALKIKTNNTERMRISAEGYVTTPYQPAFDAYHTGGSYSSGTTTTSLDLNTTRLNIGGHYSVSNDRFTAPVAGVYQFNYRAIINGAYTNGHVRLLKNTVILPGADTHFSPTANAWSQVLTQITIYLAVNDYVQVQHVGNTTIYGDNYQSFNGHLIG